MSELTLEDLSPEYLKREIDALVRLLGTGADMASAPYDTAWGARLTTIFPGQGWEQCVERLREGQLADGSWGAEIPYWHDRTICTLAAITSLATLADPRADKERIRRGVSFLWRARGRRFQDARDTVAFTPLACSLTKEAHALGLDVPPEHASATLLAKLNAFKHRPEAWHATAMSYSLEAILEAIPPDTDVERLCAANGCIAGSPAATAALLTRAQTGLTPAARYLHHQLIEQADGGLPDVSPIEIFEVTWALSNLRRAAAVSPREPALYSRHSKPARNTSRSICTRNSRRFGSANACIRPLASRAPRFWAHSTRI